MSMYRPLLALALILPLAGCSSSRGSAESPQDVAQAFWTAAQNRDQAAAMELALASDQASMDFENEDSGIHSFQLGDMVVEDGTASVPTILSAESDGKPMDLDFETVLVQSGDAWRVDMDQTTGNMIKSMLGISMEQLGAAMADGMQEAMEGMGEAMAEGMQQTMEGMADALSDVEGGR